MPVQFMPVPDNLRAAFLQTARDLFYTDTGLLADLEARPDNLFCLPVFTLTSEALLAGDRLEAARPAGFRLLFLSPDHVLAADSPATEPAATRISSFSRSPQLREAVETVLDLLRDVNLPPSVEYRARLLRVSSSYLEACWLHSPTGVGDLLVPTISGLKQVKQRTSILPGAFFESALQVASEIKATGGNQP